MYSSTKTFQLLYCVFSDAEYNFNSHNYTTWAYNSALIAYKHKPLRKHAETHCNSLKDSGGFPVVESYQISVSAGHCWGCNPSLHTPAVFQCNSDPPWLNPNSMPGQSSHTAPPANIDSAKTDEPSLLLHIKRCPVTTPTPQQRLPKTVKTDTLDKIITS